eukprot:991463-Rhodomonas_salina.1
MSTAMTLSVSTGTTLSVSTAMTLSVSTGMTLSVSTGTGLPLHSRVLGAHWPRFSNEDSLITSHCLPPASPPPPPSFLSRSLSLARARSRSCSCGLSHALSESCGSTSHAPESEQTFTPSAPSDLETDQTLSEVKNSSTETMWTGSDGAGGLGAERREEKVLVSCEALAASAASSRDCVESCASQLGVCVLGSVLGSVVGSVVVGSVV